MIIGILKNWIIYLSILVAPCVYADSQLVPVDDLSRFGVESIEHKRVVIVMVTQPDCGFCEYVKSTHIEPMLRNGTLPNTAVVRELDLAGLSFTDFSGDSISPGQFARRYDAEFSPSMLFLSDDGVQLHEPIIGVRNREFYGYYLDKAIEQSVKLLNHGE